MHGCWCLGLLVAHEDGEGCSYSIGISIVLVISVECSVSEKHEVNVSRTEL